MLTVKVARDAMATRFEILLHGEREAALRAAAEEALSEVERLESRLSAYRADSDIGRLNGPSGMDWLQLDGEVFALLARARHWHHRTRGAFDVTLGSLSRCWNSAHDARQLPEADRIEAARAEAGMEGLELDAGRLAARRRRPGLRVDLGAIGKGFAVERAVACLRESGIKSAFVQGGTSTAGTVGTAPDGEPWRVAVPRPMPDDSGPMTGDPEGRLAVVSLADASLSLSAVWGRSFVHERRRFGHVIDPGSGQPVAGAVLAVVVSPSATDSDALSTALLVRGVSAPEGWAGQEEPAGWLVAGRDGTDGRLVVRSRGITVEARTAG